jgi:hypothetical protein
MKVFAAARMDLQARIRMLDEGSSSIHLVRALISWLRENSSLLAQEPFSIYQFEKYLALKEEDYPVGVRPLTTPDLNRINVYISKYTTQNTKLLPQYLRSILESYLVLEVDEDCPNCGRSGLCVYASRVDSRLAYECRQCGFAKHQDGSPVEPNVLTIAKHRELREANLI